MAWGLVLAPLSRQLALRGAACPEDPARPGLPQGHGLGESSGSPQWLQRAAPAQVSGSEACTCLMLSSRGGKSFPRGGLRVRAVHLPKAERRQAELRPCWLCRHRRAIRLSSLGCAVLHRRSICARLRIPFPGCCTI